MATIEEGGHVTHTPTTGEAAARSVPSKGMNPACPECGKELVSVQISKEAGDVWTCSDDSCMPPLIPIQQRLTDKQLQSMIAFVCIFGQKARLEVASLKAKRIFFSTCVFFNYLFDNVYFE